MMERGELSQKIKRSSNNAEPHTSLLLLGTIVWSCTQHRRDVLHCRKLGIIHPSIHQHQQSWQDLSIFNLLDR